MLHENLVKKEIEMKDNRTSQVCDSCNSHIISYRDIDGKIIFECAYCGLVPEDINPIELEDYEDE